MTLRSRTIIWTATLAPVGITDLSPQCIDPDCVITVADNAPLTTSTYTVIGHVVSASIIDGYLTASGIMHAGNPVPTDPPTVDLSPSDKYWNEDATRLTFTAGTVSAVRTGFKPAWDDPRIRFI